MIADFIRGLARITAELRSIPPERRKRVLAKLAFIGYILERPDYWSPERGYSGFANMTSVVALYRTGIACILPAHPKAKAWAEQYWQAPELLMAPLPAP